MKQLYRVELTIMVMAKTETEARMIAAASSAALPRATANLALSVTRSSE